MQKNITLMQENLIAIIKENGRNYIKLSLWYNILIKKVFENSIEGKRSTNKLLNQKRREDYHSNY